MSLVICNFLENDSFKQNFPGGTKVYLLNSLSDDSFSKKYKNVKIKKDLIENILVNFT